MMKVVTKQLLAIATLVVLSGWHSSVLAAKGEAAHDQVRLGLTSLTQTKSLFEPQVFRSLSFFPTELIPTHLKTSALTELKQSAISQSGATDKSRKGSGLVSTVTSKPKQKLAGSSNLYVLFAVLLVAVTHRALRR